MAFERFIVVHHHGVNPQHNHLRLLNPQAPKKKRLQKRTKKADSILGKSLEKTLDCMGRDYPLGGTLDSASIARIFLQRIKLNKMTTGAANKKAEKVFEHLFHHLSLGALTDRAKKPLKMRDAFNMTKLARKWTQFVG